MNSTKTNHSTPVGGPGRYYVFFTGERDDSGISVISNTKVADHGDGVYGTWVHIIDGYTEATAETFAKIVGIASGRNITEIIGTRPEGGEPILIEAKF